MLRGRIVVHSTIEDREQIIASTYLFGRLSRESFIFYMRNGNNKIWGGTFFMSRTGTLNKRFSFSWPTIWTTGPAAVSRVYKSVPPVISVAYRSSGIFHQVVYFTYLVEFTRTTKNNHDHVGIWLFHRDVSCPLVPRGGTYKILV